MIKKAFTLIEVLVAVGILALVIGGAASIEVQNIKSSSSNKRQVEALGLAQQGLNLTKSVNDTDKLNPDAPRKFPPAAGSYNLNMTNNSLAPATVPATGVCHDLNKKGVDITIGTRTYCREIIIGEGSGVGTEPVPTP